MKPGGAAGYSKRPLAAKLGIGPGTVVAAVGAPRGYRALLAPLPPGVRIRMRPAAGAGFIHYFARSRAQLGRAFPGLARALAPAGALWISWPKLASGVPSDLTEGVVRQVGLAHGLVDVKVCAVDDTWSALKFVRRLRDR